MFELCWVCLEAPGTSDDVRNRGACGKCYARLKKRYGSGQWEAVAREAIEQGNRDMIVGFAPCPTCETGRVHLLTSKYGVCQKCKHRNKHLKPEERKLANQKRSEQRRKAAAQAKAEREFQFKQERKRGLELERERVLARNEARIRTQRAKALARPVVARIDDPVRYALQEARKNPSRLIVVPVGNPILGRSLYFEPYLDRKGNLQVRQLSDNAKGA